MTERRARRAEYSSSVDAIGGAERNIPPPVMRLAGPIGIFLLGDFYPSTRRSDELGNWRVAHAKHIMWMLRATMWMLRATMWMLRAIMWT
eukprot:1184782-Prorocentrum_minimum.AAC.2